VFYSNDAHRPYPAGSGYSSNATGKCHVRGRSGAAQKWVPRPINVTLAQNETSDGIIEDPSVGAGQGGVDVRVVLPEPVSATTIVTPFSTQYMSSSPVKDH
jgi:hypothetical protein